MNNWGNQTEQALPIHLIKWKRAHLFWFQDEGIEFLKENIKFQNIYEKNERTLECYINYWNYESYDYK